MFWGYAEHISNTALLLTFEGSGYCIITVEQTYYDWRQSALSKLIFPMTRQLAETGLKMDLVQ